MVVNQRLLVLQVNFLLSTVDQLIRAVILQKSQSHIVTLFNFREVFGLDGANAALGEGLLPLEGLFVDNKVISANQLFEFFRLGYAT